MNRFDKRLIGVSAATAAAVALVTVVVYEHVRGDQVTNIAPGATFKIEQNKAPSSSVVALEDDPPDCDPEPYRTKGTEFVNMGQYGAGLQQFKLAMRCKGGNTLAVIRLAYMSACGAGDAAAAREFFAQIPSVQQGNLVQICMRNHIDPQ